MTDDKEWLLNGGRPLEQPAQPKPAEIPDPPEPVIGAQEKRLIQALGVTVEWFIPNPDRAQKPQSPQPNSRKRRRDKNL